MLGAVTVLEVIQRTTSFLAKKGVESPRLQSELLLAHVLGLQRMQVYLNFERELTQAQEEAMRQLVIRRGQREPLQHLVGSTSFCGLEIEVNRSVLIPRPETELLAEQGWLFLNQRAKEVLEQAGTRAGSLKSDTGPLALDFGTGSGCLAIALASKCPTSAITALDISPEALETARRNAARHGVDNRIDFLLSNGLEAVPADGQFDLIIANPPYIPSAEIPLLEPEVREHDPRLALDGGADGLQAYRHLAAAGTKLLKPGGKLMVEFGDGQEVRLQELFAQEKWVVEAVRDDYTGRPRLLMARKSNQPAG